jgi:transcriptional regulator with XRE-family HTH domain
MLGSRLKEERVRLGFTQPAFAEVAGAKKRTLIDWEQGTSSPTAVQLAALAGIGVDVQYVLTGQEEPERPRLDATERALLEAYRRCGPDARANLVQSAALLAAGFAAPSQQRSVVQNVLAPVNAGGVAGGNIIHKGSGRRKS